MQKFVSILRKTKSEQEAEYYSQQYKDLNEEIDAIRKERLDLLKGADLPLPGLSVVDGELTFNDQHWDNMSGSEQLRVATAIVRKLKPECGFVLIDKLEQMDIDTMKEFGKWLEQEDLQAIATRVSSGDECQIIIEDGYVVGQESLPKENDLKVEEKGWEF
ncbi:cullin [Erysipelothrix sp. Poltava]|nr:cullin [Erysipelothrix sp. Poltava]